MSVGVAILLFVLIAIGFGFARAGSTLNRYYRRIKDQNDPMSKNLRESHPKWFAYMRAVAPIVILGFYFNAVIATVGALYVLSRWVSENY